MRLRWLRRGPRCAVFESLLRGGHLRRGWHNHPSCRAILKGRPVIIPDQDIEEESFPSKPLSLAERHDQYIEGRFFPSTDLSLTERRLLARARLSGIESLQQLEYEADVGHTNDIGSRMTDTAQFRQDLDLWRLLLEFSQHRNGAKGAKKIWLAMMFRGKPVQLESDNRNASDLMQSIIAASAADDIDYLKTFVKDCIRRGILQEQLFVWVVGTLLVLQPEAAPSLAIMLRQSCFQGKADLLEIFHLACQSDNANALRCFCQVHSLFTGFYIYNNLIPSLWEANRASDAFMLHQHLLSKGDLPRTFEVLKPFVQHIASTNGDLEAFLRGLRAADISFDAQILRLHSTLLAKPLKKANEPRKISDEIAARILASFPFEFAIRNLRFFGLIEVGPLFVRQMVKSAANSKDLKERFETLKELEIDLGSSAFVRLVRRLSSNGVFETVKQVADSDMHHDEYEDHDLQKDLLREYHMTDNYRGITHTLTIFSEGDLDPRHQDTSNSLLLRSAIEMGDHLKTLQTVDHVCQQGCLVEEDTLKLLIQNMLHPAIQTNNSVDSVGFLIGLLQRLLGAGNRIPPWMWLRPLVALATQGRLEEFERLLMWLADWYAASSAKRHSVAKNLPSLLTPPMQNAIIDWSFKKAAWKQSRGNLKELNLTSSSATAGSSLPWLRGAAILKALRDEYNIAIELESLHATFNLCIKRLYYIQGLHRQAANRRVGIKRFGMSPRSYLRSWYKFWNIPLTPDEEDQLVKKILQKPSPDKLRRSQTRSVHRRRTSEDNALEIE